MLKVLSHLWMLALNLQRRVLHLGYPEKSGNCLGAMGSALQWKGYRAHWNKRLKENNG